VSEWWRTAVVYEIYVRSFADSDGDGLGDLPGIRSRLRYLRDLGVDAIWLTPFYPSPDADHGYDVSDYTAVDPRFGTLEDFDGLVADAHALGLRVVVDVVPNHTSIEHPWFAGRPELYVWADEPNNWPSTFGGSAWTLDAERGRYYLHLYAPEQPDLDWHNEDVPAEFERILRFWLDRGVDGFRVDVAHGLYKDPELRDELVPVAPGPFSSDWRAAIDQPEVHELYRKWRRLVDGYEGERVLVGEVVFSDPARVAAYVRPDELGLAFNFTFLFTPWDAEQLRSAVDRSLAAYGAVGAPSTWVLESHDVTRLPTRCGGGQEGARAARAACLLLLGLPGAVFLYAGQELGLEEVDLPDEARQDPVFFRSGGDRVGRDGCRVPLPWSDAAPTFGFTTGTPWLPMSASWGASSVARQSEDPASSLALYRAALAVRRASPALREGAFAWRGSPAGSLVWERTAAGERLVCAVNVDAEQLAVPAGEQLVASEPVDGVLPPGAAVWLREN
jgi:alpha-glucosidase